MILKPHGDEFRSVIKPTITHGLVQDQASFIAGDREVIGADGTLKCPHRVDQMNDVMGLIPGWIQQRQEG